MTDGPSLRELRRQPAGYLQKLRETGWYHSFELPDGTMIEGGMTLEWQRQRWARFPIPSNLGGKRVLDIGAWDGWFSFEAERRGAEVTSVDYVEVPNYLDLHRRLGSKAGYRNLDMYELPGAGLGRFDIVLCLGVLYHLRHPFLGVEIVCSLASELAIIETFVTDAATWREHQDDIPTMEFYETDELKGQADNWNGPTVGCLLAMCRAAGFVRVELLAVDSDSALVACYRKWEPEPAEPAAEPPELLSAVNAVHFGVNFSSKRDEYVWCRFRTVAESVTRQDLRLQVGEFGAPATSVWRDAGGSILANFRVPPGAAAGWNQVRLRLAGSRFSNPRRIAIDVPVAVERIAIAGIRDSLSWQSGEVHIGDGGYVSCWVGGLPDNADRSNVRLRLGEHRLPILFFGEPDQSGNRQINARVPRECERGELGLRVECAGVTAEVAVSVR